ncbi:hypothetical protein [Rubinisphaera margarita]|uniref:hypothetical protein n=1 Tax=Rubinisphaera margarita TaxID=2909586 RepID=UPI001EE8D71C|nr:hypothetical protein [Rubinisphaera margarita]MCG6157588.1 hypothetical protein [Rubinisphaera margarita]
MINSFFSRLGTLCCLSVLLLGVTLGCGGGQEAADVNPHGDGVDAADVTNEGTVQ